MVKSKCTHTLIQLADELKKAEKILIFPHINADGDAVGSAAALAHSLRLAGKEAYVLIEDIIPANLIFMTKECFTTVDPFDGNYNLAVCVDCGDTSRFPRRTEMFFSAEKTMLIDHHSTTIPFCDYNYVDDQAAATGEIIFTLLKDGNIPFDKIAAECIFAAITTDTGNFQYSNTTKTTHEITSYLYDMGINASEISIKLYENQRIEMIKLKNMSLSSMESFCEGKCAICYVTKEMLRNCGAYPEETEGIASELRTIGNIEIAAFLKELDDGRVKLSLRSKHYADVSQIASGFGGGGHIRAAGAVIDSKMENAINEIKSAICEYMRGIKI